MSTLNLTADHSTGDVLTLSGPITRETCSVLRSLLAPHLGERLQVRLSTDVRLDIDGLFALAVFHQDTRDHGGTMTITASPPQIEQYIRDHHMGDLLDMETTERDL